mmetsp:Transcript_5236/g.21587  ORF Transcript_5236/g.21587 Transcript_5236/m.21587 type:complete len:236 (+) Transcript_5236:3503-4210(+)
MVVFRQHAGRARHHARLLGVLGVVVVELLVLGLEVVFAEDLGRGLERGARGVPQRRVVLRVVSPRLARLEALVDLLLVQEAEGLVRSFGGRGRGPGLRSICGRCVVEVEARGRGAERVDGAREGVAVLAALGALHLYEARALAAHVVGDGGRRRLDACILDRVADRRGRGVEVGLGGVEPREVDAGRRAPDVRLGAEDGVRLFRRRRALADEGLSCERVGRGEVVSPACARCEVQ